MLPYFYGYDNQFFPEVGFALAIACEGEEGPTIPCGVKGYPIGIEEIFSPYFSFIFENNLIWSIEDEN